MQRISAANGSMPAESASSPALHNGSEVGFWFYVRTMDSGQGLAQAMFALYRNDSLLTYLRSDADGRVDVPALPPGRYEWLQTQAPPGHHSDVKLHILYIGSQGDVYVDMHPAGAGQYAVKNARA
ncbi:MAG TPA: prealbumin-like fold domain-containing protein, partial [Clostridia bacterium]|nr:prealbumin-like fold domain-containing protein [Clostridia bacterium]